jgi:tetratricopeptide (TPR) repeat protein
MPVVMPHPSAAALHREVLRLMQAREWPAAQGACRRLTSSHPALAAGWVAASHIAMALKAPAEAIAHIDRALRIEPRNGMYRIYRAQCLLALGRRAEALQAAAAAEQSAGADARAWDAIGSVRSYAADQRGALAAYERAVALDPDNPQLLYNRASVRRFVGDLDGAEADYDRVIALKPQDFEAYLNRSELRAQTPQRNHVAALEAALASRPDWRGEFQLRFALAKECEDLGDYARSFEELRRGAEVRRKHLQYDVAADVATVDWIIEAFPAARAGHPLGTSAADPAHAAAPSAPSAAHAAHPGGASAADPTAPAGQAGGAAAAAHAPRSATGGADDPVFVVGLPRSGTTLVERVLASHSALSSAGELDCFALALVDAAQRRSGRAQLPRRDLVAACATLDFAALGADYLARARASSGVEGRFIDKMPLNYLYCGLILRALPNARIIHVTRHPMAVCYAMYKTLFKNGYPFSYDLGEIAQYYVAYRRLMQHWQRSLPGAIHDVSYERMVADQTGETRRLLDYCGLQWEDACIDFHRNPAPSTTASASQVRRPLYDSSVAQWRHYESQLLELKVRLAAEGIDVDY